MQQSPIQFQGDNIIIDKNALIMYVVIAAVIIVLLAIVTIALRRRNKGFVKTMPTNVKDVE